MIRGKTKICPFGLSVPGGCLSAGGPSSEDESPVISKMVPLEYAKDKASREDIVKDNLEEFFMLESPERCPFADRIFEEREGVDCKFDEQTGQMPAGSAGINGSPIYPHITIGDSTKPQYGYPVNQYSDDNENTSVYYGIYSLIG